MAVFNLIHYRNKAVFSVFAVWVIFLFPGDVSDEWALKLQKNGISVYTKSVKGSRIKAVKSVYNAKSTLSGVIALLLDVPNYQKWIYRCGAAKLLKTESPAELIYYQLTDVPWPASDRDMVARLSIRQEKETGIVKAIVENRPGYLPEKPGKVRLMKFDLQYILIPKAQGNVEVTTELVLDPGGNIPAWMINQAATLGPYNTAVGMINNLDSKGYQNATFGFIKE